jgi:hypothetical protein
MDTIRLSQMQKHKEGTSNFGDQKFSLAPKDKCLALSCSSGLKS